MCQKRARHYTGQNSAGPQLYRAMTIEHDHVSQDREKKAHIKAKKAARRKEEKRPSAGCDCTPALPDDVRAEMRSTIFDALSQAASAT